MRNDSSGAGGGAIAVSKLVAGEFDPPPGDGKEDPTHVGQVIDNNLQTYWQTEEYPGGLAATKKGVGVTLDLGATKTIASITVNTIETGWKAELFLSSKPSSELTALTDWGASIAALDVGGTTIAYGLPQRTRARSVLVWFTQPRDQWARKRARLHITEAQVGQTDDNELAALAAGGDRRALEQLLERHADRIHALCRRVIPHREDALDATQEAMIAVARGISRFDGRAAFTTWLYRVATNAALDELRRKRRRPEPTDPALIDEPARGSALEDRVGARLDVDAALAALPEEFRVAVVLRDLCDLDYAEIAEVLDIPPGTVRSRIARGRAALLELLGNHEATSPRRSE